MPPERPPTRSTTSSGSVAGAGRGAWPTSTSGSPVPAAARPGWLGDDAAAAAAQVGAVAALVARRLGRGARRSRAGWPRTPSRAARRPGSRSRRCATSRTSSSARRWRRWGAGPGPAAADHDRRPGRPGDRRGGRGRRRRAGGGGTHALLEELARRRRRDGRACSPTRARRSAAAAGRATPTRGRLPGRASCPGWGDLELARRGRALAGRLTRRAPRTRGPAPRRTRPPSRAAARSPNALLAGLGRRRGHATLLRVPRRRRARTRRAPLPGCSRRPSVRPCPERRHDPVAQRPGRRVRRRRRPVRTAGHRGDGPGHWCSRPGWSMPSGGGRRPRTVAEWSRQLLLREREQRERVGRRSGDRASERRRSARRWPSSVLAERADPARRRPRCSDEPGVWEVLLGRVLGRRRCGPRAGDRPGGPAPGAAGDRAVRTGLAAVGAGLDAGDPAELDGRPGHPRRGGAGARGRGGRAHRRGARRRSQVGARRATRPATGDVLRGLGYRDARPGRRGRRRAGRCPGGPRCSRIALAGTGRRAARRPSACRAPTWRCRSTASGRTTRWTPWRTGRWPRTSSGSGAQRRTACRSSLPGAAGRRRRGRGGLCGRSGSTWTARGTTGADRGLRLRPHGRRGRSRSRRWRPWSDAELAPSPSRRRAAFDRTAAVLGRARGADVPGDRLVGARGGSRARRPG